MSNNSIITAVGGPLDVTAKIIATGPRGQDGDVTREEFDTHLAESTTYMGYLERDATLPTGLQSIVGLGFKPKSILLFASSVAAGTKFSVGFDNGVSHLTLYNNYIPSGGAFAGTVGVSVFLRESSANSNSAFIQSFDTDGFTLSWETNGTPINKNRVYYVAFR